ncbi:hypothetical protein [Sphingorhabdus sp. YGSMI21]|uniref:hypothetical protein n=1 Tax=Sphingorhabdus sp. YGSMI21 TaxID=2077182 RepID=UPI000C1ED4FF|nr:hypothetical protein [Sphingorhabdus sp. YGSMI21]ATW02378.1 hypothetical protein CHN51_01685 [Sphingorhabdus sp. YGSMI21]
MSNMRVILLEAAMVAGVLMTGLSASQIAYAATASADEQKAATDPRANVKIDSSIMVERTEISEDGESVTQLLSPSAIKVVPGDKLLVTNSYRNLGDEAVTGFVLNNPVHQAVTFVEALEDWALVSVDGGEIFGPLSSLSVADDEQGSRPAVAADVTHIRWVLPSPIEPGATGELRFRGTVK